MPALWAFCGFALHGGGTAGASEGPSVGYVEGKTAFGAANYPLVLRTRLKPLRRTQRIKGILKIFLEMFKRIEAETLTLQRIRHCG
jgi:hypothetical protein